MGRRVDGDGVQSLWQTCGRLLAAVLSGWLVLAAAELVLLFGVLRLFSLVMGPDLLPSLKIVFDMGAFLLCGLVAGRSGRPHNMIAAGLTALGLATLDLTPYVPLNVAWLVRLTGNAWGDSRYLPSLLNTAAVHAFLFGSLFAGAFLSRPREAPSGRIG